MRSKLALTLGPIEQLAVAIASSTTRDASDCLWVAGGKVTIRDLLFVFMLACAFMRVLNRVTRKQGIMFPGVAICKEWGPIER